MKKVNLYLYYANGSYYIGDAPPEVDNGKFDTPEDNYTLVCSETKDIFGIKENPDSSTFYKIELEVKSIQTGKCEKPKIKYSKYTPKVKKGKPIEDDDEDYDEYDDDEEDDEDRCNGCGDYYSDCRCYH